MMSRHIPVSAFVITKNEEAHITQVLAALSCFDEVIVVDSGSSDNTVRLAKQAGATVIHQDWLGYAKQKNFAMEQCRNTWLINIDGDEVLSQNNIDEVTTIINEDKADAIRLNFDDLLWGESMACRSRKRSIIRVFKRTHATYPIDRLVHENLVLKKGARVASIKSLVTHYGYDSTEVLTHKFNRYSSLKAQEKFNKTQLPSSAKLLLVYPLTFVKVYLFRKMFLSGIRGVIVAHLEATYAFLKEAKLFELTHSNER